MEAATHELETLGPVLARTQLMVPMRDGVRLATDVYWDGSVPLESLSASRVLLERSPYDIRAVRASDGRHADGTPVTPESGADFFVRQGYVVVRQDCRGRGGSEGAFSKYTGEAADGHDTHAWLATRAWCDGTVITQGVSYSAHTQAAAASVGARPLSAMIMDSGGFSNAWQAGGRLGGAFELKQVLWAMRRASLLQSSGGSSAAHRAGADELRAWFDAMPWRKGFSPLSTTPDYEDFVFEQWSHEALDDFWRQPGLFAQGYYDAFPAVPLLSMSSWYDPYVFSAIDNYHAARRANPHAALVLGPWTHGARSVSHAGDVDFGSRAPLDGNLASDYLTFKADWLASALDPSRSSAAEPPVRYFLMGGGSGHRTGNRLDHGGQWLSATDWPPPEARPSTLYLHPTGTLEHDRPDPGEVTYDFDPRQPVPSRGGGITSGEPLMSGGAFDQVDGLPLAARHDVVTFQTEPLTKPVAVVGEVTLKVKFSSSARDTDLTAKLVDVHPPNQDYPAGFAMNVTDHMLRLRYRDDPTKANLMVPGEVYTVTIRLPDTANLFDTGHRIRLDISSSNFPRCDVNPNTGAPVLGDRTLEVARNTIHLGDSLLVLSTVPRSSWAVRE